MKALKSMKSMPVSIAAALGTLLGASAARAEISIIDNNKSVAIDCAKDPAVNLVGNHITVALNGVCSKISITGNNETVTGAASAVTIAGSHNTVTLSAADDVIVAGNSNTLIVRKPIKAAAPRITNTGKDNRITRPS
jgi:hypothetical protein